MKTVSQTNLYPFKLEFDGLCARFSFIFDNTPVNSIGNHTAPSCLISNREAGDMTFRLPNKNRELFFASMGIPPEKVYSLRQIHSRDVFTLNRPQPAPEVLSRETDSICEADGLVSLTGGFFLAVTVADCLPVFLLDTENGFCAALHSGWKGTGIVLNALEIMKNSGSRPEAIAAVLGPCIQSCCYNVDEKRAKSFEAEFGSGRPELGIDNYPLGKVTRREKSSWFLNLQAANARLLAAAGIRHIAYNTDCTFTDERLGSFRREGKCFTNMIAMTGGYW